jgi:hypothetical protein
VFALSRSVWNDYGCSYWHLRRFVITFCNALQLIIVLGNRLHTRINRCSCEIWKLRLVYRCGLQIPVLFFNIRQSLFFVADYYGQKLISTKPDLNLFAATHQSFWQWFTQLLSDLNQLCEYRLLHWAHCRCKIEWRVFYMVKGLKPKKWHSLR